jgi:RND family efflux transporter MFP subunit
MKRKWLLITGAILVAGTGLAVVSMVTGQPHGDAHAAIDPRTAPQLVRVAVVSEAEGITKSFTGTVAARVESDLGFRVSGKIVERLVDVGDQVAAGQPLMRLDDTDLKLVLTAKRNAVLATQAILVQVTEEEKRTARLQKSGLIVSLQRYEQVKAALDTAKAQLAASEAEADVAENATTYSTLVADVAGTITATLAETGQVIAAGQPVIRIAQSGAREAVVNLPETVRPTVGSTAEARVYGSMQPASAARLRLISDAADPQSRTFEARYVLEGEAAGAPLGSTVTVSISDTMRHSDVAVPLGAILDDGKRVGVWSVDRATSTVRFVPVEIMEMGAEMATVIGLSRGEHVVALGAHLLKEGAEVRIHSIADGVN